MRKITYQDRLRYQFDNTMSRGPIALIGWLFLISAALVFIFALLVWSSGIAPTPDGGTQPGFVSLLWSSLLHSMDAGTVAGDVGSPWYLWSMMGVTLGGIFIVSMFIGILSNGLQERVEDLRKGRSFVVEQDHTVILGWSSQIFSIISELIIANANQSRSCIVVLADHDKVEMEDEIRTKIGDTGRTRIVCRSGNPVDLADIEVVNPDGARSIIILGPETENPDSAVIKTILAITNHPKRRPQPYHIVAEIRDPQNMEVARMVGRHEAQLVLVGDLIARITVQTCQQSGLSVIYTELLDFDGDEIYFQEEPTVVGKQFGEALLAYEESSLIGLRRHDGTVLLNPPMDLRIASGDQVIAISSDDNTVRVSDTTPTVDTTAMRTATERPTMPSRTLILGWNERARTIVAELNNYVGAGSTITVVADDPTIEQTLASMSQTFQNQTVQFLEGDIVDRRLLDALDAPSFKHIIVLSYSDKLEEQEADSQTLITLLHLRDIAERTGQNLSIVSEMLDIRNRDLAEVTKADDFIVSDKLIGLMLAQISENKELTAVFEELFDADGSEIYLKPIEDYVAVDRPLNFYTVVESARQRGEIAIGYRRYAQSSDAAHDYGVRVNPRKSENVTFAAQDSIIVLASS